MNIGRYQVVRLLGQGGMASVYEACEPSLNRRVAIKVLHAEMAKDSEVIARFVAEGRIVNGIRHPSLVPVHEQGQLADGSYYIVMDLMEGETLSRRLSRSVHRPVSLEEALRIGRQVAEALATVHRHGVVHRDIKPDNLMLVSDPAVFGGVRVKILDFGLAKILRAKHGTEMPKTVVGCAYGTPSYMAPEQMFDARGATDRADVYSFGATLFEMLTGRSPFPGSEPLQIWGAQLTKEPPDVRVFVPSVPRPLAMMMQRMLHREAVARPSMEDVLRQLTYLAREEYVRGNSKASGAHPKMAAPPAKAVSASDLTVIQHGKISHQAPSSTFRRLAVATIVAMPLLILVYSCTPSAEKERPPIVIPNGPTPKDSPTKVTPVDSPRRRNPNQGPVQRLTGGSRRASDAARQSLEPQFLMTQRMAQ